MESRITAIPPTLNRFTSTPVFEAKKRKVAGYARVSTDMEEQQSSYENQVDYYTNYIKSRDDWEYVAVYTDEGISATSTRHREGFNRMIEDALNGLIDLIVTKSISRFARNTVDSLTTIRKLKEKGVEVFFEKENIWTFDSKGELLITIMSSLAQEESRSISENTTWGRRKSFADGKVSVSFSTFLGYDEGFQINDEQAETVRLIYKLYMTGLSYHAIMKELEKRGRLTATGLKHWTLSAVRSVLHNEKYTGNALLQNRWICEDILTEGSKQLRLYLNGNALSRCPGDGTISYVYDPNNPTCFEGICGNVFGRMELQPDTGTRSDIISFISEPFDKKVTVKGAQRITLKVSSDCPDTAFYARVSLVRSDNTTYPLRDRITSLSHELDAYTPSSSVIIRMILDPIAFEIKPSEKLRLDIASACFPVYYPHSNTDQLWSSSDSCEKATNILHLADCYIDLFYEN